MGAYSTYTQCGINPATGENVRCRTHAITQQAQNGGAACPHHDGEVICTTSGCSQAINCQGDFEAWSACEYYASKHMFIRTKTYKISQPAVNGGLGCPYANGYKVDDSTGCSQPVDCEGEWGEYGICYDPGEGMNDYEDRRSLLGSSQAIDGLKIRCRRYSITKHASNNGYACPFANDKLDCTDNGCAQKVNCVGSFSDYGSCSYTGQQNGHKNIRCKVYSITTPPSEDGEACPYQNGHEVCTEGGCVQPVNCQYSWQEGTCQIESDGVSRKCSTFVVTQYPEHNGYACPYAQGYQSCFSMGCAQPVDCVGHWEDYLDETTTNSEEPGCMFDSVEEVNKRCQIYMIDQVEQNGGQACPHPASKMSCTKDGCTQQVDCEYQWTPVVSVQMRRNLQNMQIAEGSAENCEYDPATKQNVQCKEVQITQEASHNGKVCPYADGHKACDAEGCAQPKNCAGVWGDFSACKYNADGSHTNHRCRVYTHTSKAEAGGEECPYPNGAEQCLVGGCVQPVDCKHHWELILMNPNLDPNDPFGDEVNSRDETNNGCMVDPVLGVTKKCKKVVVTDEPKHNGYACPHPAGHEECTEEGCNQPVNCVGTWSPFEECEYDPVHHTSKMCRKYQVSVASAHGGFMCPFANNQKQCKTEGCAQPIDCQVAWSPYNPSGNQGLQQANSTGGSSGQAGAGSPYGACFYDTDTDVNRRCEEAEVLVYPANYGKVCDAISGELKCTTDGCEQPVNCMGVWTSYGQCAYKDVTDTNMRCRKFKVTQEAQHGGQACGYEHNQESCTPAGCGQPVDCEWEWGTYGSCQFQASSQSNKRCREFNVTTVPDYNGEQCPYPNGYSQCTDEGCDQPVDCEGSWGEYETCFLDKEADVPNNKRCRKYVVTKAAAYGGAQCPHTEGEQQCTQGGCDQPIDCIFAWFSKPQIPGQTPNVNELGPGPCKISNGESKMCSYASILIDAKNGGKSCPFPDAYEQCTTQNCTQPNDCVGAWNDFGECSYDSLTHTVEKCREYTITTQAAYGGEMCPHVSGKTQCTKGGCAQPVDCEYEFVDATPCESYWIDTPPGIGGEYDPYNDWDPMTVTGFNSTIVNKQCKTVKVVTAPENSGKLCAYEDGVKICTQQGCAQPIPCVGSFVEDESCTYNAAKATNRKCSTFVVTQEAQYGGFQCAYQNGYKTCSTADCAQPSDCEWEWQYVDVPNSENNCFLNMTTMEKTRCKEVVITAPAANNGKQCPMPEGTRSCTKNGCDQPKACVGHWEPAGPCHYDDAMKINKKCKFYVVDSEAAHGGAECQHEDGQQQCFPGGCTQPVDCEGSFTEWDSCAFNNITKSRQSCRTYQVTTSAEANGLECSLKNGHKECAEDMCDQPVNCQYGWSQYESCFHDVASDENKRCKSISWLQEAQFGGLECAPHIEVGYKSCTKAGCGQPVDCEHEWGAYGSCSYYATTQDNKRCRVFNITTVPDNNGEQCPHNQGYTECTTEGCAQPVDCVGAWQDYEACMHEEGEGVNLRCRIYKVETEAKHGGAECPVMDGLKDCTQSGCDQPVDCLGEWGEYSGSCKYNNETKLNENCRSFEITREAEFQGKQCLHKHNELQCSPQNCPAPVDCVGSWDNYGTCFMDKDTQMNKKCRKYSIETEASHNGGECPFTQGEEDCTTEECPQPVDCVGQWEQYGACEFDANLGENKRCKLYTVVTESANGGAQCPHATGEKQCNATLCAQPVDCVGKWSDIGSCAYDQSEHTNKACKVYSIEVEAANNGAQCAHANNEESCAASVCDQPVNCIGEWVTKPNCTLSEDSDVDKWESCSTYRIVTPAAHSGVGCAHTDGHVECTQCEDEKVPVDCEHTWQQQVTDECANGGLIRNCSIFTVTQAPNDYGKQCDYADGYELCRNIECSSDDNGSSGQNTGDGKDSKSGAHSVNEDSEKETSTASTQNAIMYGAIGAAALLLCCCVPLCIYHRRKKRKQAGLGQQVEGRKYSLLNYGGNGMVTMPTSQAMGGQANPMFNLPPSSNGNLGGAVTFSNPLTDGMDGDYNDSGSGFEPTTDTSNRGSMSEGFFNPMFVQEQQEEVVGTLQQQMYDMWSYVDTLEESESLAFGEIKKDMQEAMISWTQVEEQLIDSEGQVLTQNVTSEEMEDKLKMIRQKLNKIEQTAFMSSDIKAEDKNSLSNLINQARGKLRRVSTAQMPPQARRKTTMPAEWKSIRNKLKAVKAMRNLQG